MRLTVPEPQIKLYETGFQGIDLLDRSATGKQLSDLVERIDDPMVIAVDGAWGSGKSVFLKCWVGAHSHENGGSAQTVYFDAFRNDYLDDPLLGLISVIAERFEEKGEKPKVIERIRNSGAALVKPSVRIGLAAATAGLSEILGPILDSVAEKGASELGSKLNDVWSEQQDRKAQMEAFRQSLVDLTKDADGDPRRLVIAIDELDRCRPDYALSVLEVIKHFFDVDGVHFVLGVNLDELANSVRARYGAGTDAGQYLQKFVTLTMRLPESSEHPRTPREKVLDYFKQIEGSMSLDSQFCEVVRTYLSRSPLNQIVTLRTIDRIATQMALVETPQGGFRRWVIGYQYLTAGLVIMKAVYPQAYGKALDGTFQETDITECFGSVDKSAVPPD